MSPDIVRILPGKKTSCDTHETSHFQLFRDFNYSFSSYLELFCEAKQNYEIRLRSTCVLKFDRIHLPFCNTNPKSGILTSNVVNRMFLLAKLQCTMDLLRGCRHCKFSATSNMILMTVCSRIIECDSPSNILTTRLR